MLKTVGMSSSNSSSSGNEDDWNNFDVILVPASQLCGAITPAMKKHMIDNHRDLLL